MSKTNDLYNQLIATINNMQNKPPPPNPAQDMLTSQSIQGANFLAGRDYRDLSKAGMFFNFDQPDQQNQQRQKLTNASDTGTFQLGDNAGNANALGLAKNYLQDKFARDTAQNFQNNVAGAGANVQSGLAESSGAAAGANALDLQKQQAILGSLGNMYGQNLAKPSIWGSILGAIGGVGSAVLTGGAGSLASKI